MNELSKEKSLYLQQHAANPVNWMAWGSKAFERAKQENKPLLISIGYSTCHWCHVMEHESFEDAEIAELLNTHFVAIKVDREEHPEVDHFYMDALHTMTERGGWPLNMFCVPDERKPFFGGTYFPKASFAQVLSQIHAVWTNEPKKILDQAELITSYVDQNSKIDQMKFELLSDPLANRKAWGTKLCEHLTRQLDPVWGGFGNAPKFPRAHGISALIRSATEQDQNLKASALAASAQTLKAMAYGGLRDHFGGGFHRYSTDAEWLVPHIEKMLYDQALLIQSYAEGFWTFGEDFYADIVQETLEFLERDFRLPSGLFAAAQDADSEGVEGKFFVWSWDELDAALSAVDAETRSIFEKSYRVSRDGNWEHTNVIAASLDAKWETLCDPRLKKLRNSLYDKRKNRIAPLTDSKAILSWNAWMATGLLRASILTQNRSALSLKLLEAGQRTLEAITMLAPLENLPHIAYATDHFGKANLEDLAALAEAYQWLGQRTLHSEHWQRAETILSFIERNFRTPEGKLMPVQKNPNHGVAILAAEDQDGATPAGRSSWIGSLIRQALWSDNTIWTQKFNEELSRVAPILDKFPIAVSHLLEQLPAKPLVLKGSKESLNSFVQETLKTKNWPDAVFYRYSAGDLELCTLGSCLEKSNLPNILTRLQQLLDCK